MYVKCNVFTNENIKKNSWELPTITKSVFMLRNPRNQHILEIPKKHL